MRLLEVKEKLSIVFFMDQAAASKTQSLAPKVSLSTQMLSMKCSVSEDNNIFTKAILISMANVYLHNKNKTVVLFLVYHLFGY